MQTIDTLFNKDELFLLKRIGLEFKGNELHVFKQGKKPRLFRIYKISAVNKIAVLRTNRRKFTWLSIFNLFNQSMILETEEHASQIFSLVCYLKSRAICLTEITDFDLLKTSRLIERLNLALKTGIETE